MITINESFDIFDDEKSLGSVGAAIQTHPDKAAEIENALRAAFSQAQSRGIEPAQRLAIKLNESNAALVVNQQAAEAALAEHDAAHAEVVAKRDAAHAEVVAKRDAAHAEVVATMKAEQANIVAEAKIALDAASAKTAAVVAEHEAYKAAAGKAASAIHSVIADTTKDDSVTVATITQILQYGEREANKTARERELEAAKATLEAAQAKVDELSK